MPTKRLSTAGISDILTIDQKLQPQEVVNFSKNTHN